MKHLLLCRHAKSSWKDSTLTDIDRPLNKRGRKNGPEMGRRLAHRGVKPDLIVSSSARRALKTARIIAREVGVSGKEVVVMDGVYDSFPSRLMQVIRKLDNQYDRVLLVGHNPETTMVANILGDLTIDNVPTCGIVALDFNVTVWQDVCEGKGVLVFFDYPKKKNSLETEQSEGA